MAYDLAKILVYDLHHRGSLTFNAFVRDAKRADAGNAAALQHYGNGLDVILGQLLGPGAWTPQPATWAPQTDEYELRITPR